MATLARTELLGQQAVINALKDFHSETLENKIKEAMKEGAEIIAADARSRAPVGTREPRPGVGVGRLKASIKAGKVKGGKGKRLGVRVEADYPKNAGTRKNKTAKQAAGSKEYYAFAIEYGTRKMPAQPFLAPALAAKAPDVFGKIQNAMEEACREAERAV